MNSGLYSVLYLTYFIILDSVLYFADIECGFSHDGALLCANNVNDHGADTHRALLHVCSVFIYIVNTDHVKWSSSMSAPCSSTLLTLHLTGCFVTK